MFAPSVSRGRALPVAVGAEPSVVVVSPRTMIVWPFAVSSATVSMAEPAVTVSVDPNSSVLSSIRYLVWEDWVMIWRSRL